MPNNGHPKGPSAEQVLAALSAIQDPDLGRDVVSLGMIKDLAVSDSGRVSFVFELTTPACPVRDRFQSMARELVGGLPGVTAVDLKMTANVRAAFGGRSPEQVIPGVKHAIAVGSGKGGVGKSTVAVNLAASLQRSGASVGLLDADIYGPSVPAMLGVDGQPKVLDQKLIPLEAYGLKLMSIGLLAGADKAMVWRGPMVSRAIEQMLTDVRWGELDYLVVDLPPGTGDASLTLAQSVALTGVAIVCTPQEAALRIAVKALQMFRGLNVPALGLIENMSWFVCSRCNEEHHIFDHGKAERAAQRLGVPYLGAIPLDKAIREEADHGAPVVASRPETAGAHALDKVASAVAARIAVQSFRQLPVINVR
ncbi:MAG TPA: Mrp/NBP35 family ATP-binding protein [Candidatus Baltobacterales bacterium]|nr:Mrp/NBP35 family ATP-binding protein [Candidatus Baltobacterales bacterium]